MKKGEKMSDDIKSKISNSHKGMKKPWSSITHKGKKKRPRTTDEKKRISVNLKKYISEHPEAKERLSYKKEKHWNWQGGKTSEIQNL